MKRLRDMRDEYVDGLTPAGGESRDAELVRLRGENARLEAALADMLAAYAPGEEALHSAVSKARAALQLKGASDA